MAERKMMNDAIVPPFSYKAPTFDRAEICRFPLIKAPALNGFESVACRVGWMVGILAHLPEPGPNGSVPDSQLFSNLP
jgi:hypothetical protein